MTSQVETRTHHTGENSGAAAARAYNDRQHQQSGTSDTLATSETPAGTATATPGRSQTPKRVTFSNRDDNDNDADRRQRRRLHQKPCCRCSRFSTCQRSGSERQAGCPCFAEGRVCTNCAAPKCRNCPEPPSTANPSRPMPLLQRPICQIVRQRPLTTTARPPPLPPPDESEERFLTQEDLPPHADEAAAIDETTTDSDSEDDDPSYEPPSSSRTTHNQRPTATDPVTLPPLPPLPPDPIPPDHTSFAIDTEIERIYGQPVLHCDGTMEHGGITDDDAWQVHFDRLAAIGTRQYTLPKGAVGKEFLELFTTEWRGILERKWNAERPLVCLLVILQRADGVKRSADIRDRIRQRMSLWKESQFGALVEDTEMEVTGRIQGPPKTDPESRARSFNGQVLSGRLRKAVRNLTNRDLGGTLDPTDTCSKTGQPVLDVLREKHPEARPTNIHAPGSFEQYDGPPMATIPLEVTADHVERTASRLSGAAGVDGIDGVELRHWLMHFGERSLHLRQVMADTTAWLANTKPPWAAYRALTACRLVALDKQPGTRPVGIGSAFRRLLSKVLLLIAGPQASQACGNTNLCAGLPAGIEGAVHALSHTTTTPTASHSTNGDTSNGSSVAPEPQATADAIDDPLVTILVDAKNGFNELNRGAMLRTVRYLWPKGATFAFNFYKRQSRLYLRHRSRHESTILLSQEGVTQGDPLSMVLFGLAVTPLGNHLRALHPTILQLWYADDYGLKGPASKARKVVEDVKTLGASIGFFVEPSKSLAICPENHQTAAQHHLEGLDLKLLTGARYLGGFLGEDSDLEDWIKPKIQEWVRGIEELALVARRFPQTAFAGLAKSFQQEWAFLQRVVPASGPLFQEVETAINQTFLPSLFSDDCQLPDNFRETSTRPVRHAGLGIPDPTKSGEEQMEASKAITSTLTNSLLAGSPFDFQLYRQEASNTRSKLKSERDAAHAAALKAQTASLSRKEQRLFQRAGQTGIWLTMAPNSMNGTDLSAEEFRDNLCLRYGIDPPKLPSKCDGCGVPFTLEHALCCSKGGHPIIRHNDLCKEWHALCAQALTPSAVTDEPLIHSCQQANSANANRRSDDSAHTQPATTPPETRGDVAAHGFWSRHNTTIFDVRIVHVEAPSYRGQDHAKILARRAKEKKDKHLQACLERRRHFTPLVFSTDGLRSPEADAACKRLAALLATKWKRTYSQVCAFVRSRVAISLARSVSMSLRGPKDPTARLRSYNWEAAGTGLGIYH